MKIRLKIFGNPFSLFSAIWMLCLICYLFGWAEVYPKLTYPLIFFSVLIISVYGVAGIFLHKLQYRRHSGDYQYRLGYIVLANSFFWCLNFGYSGIPVMNAVKGNEFDHIAAWGIPSFIVFVVSFTGFLSQLCFLNYLKQKKKIYLLYYLINIGFFVLMYSRGAIMLTIFTSFFLWLNVNRASISLKGIMGIALAFVLLMYIFGVAGNYRVMKELQSDGTEYNSKLILELAQPSKSFENNLIPNEFLWSYLYLTSPYGNLQENINLSKTQVSQEKVTTYFISQFTWDFISKRILSSLNIKRSELYVFVPALAVCTTFAEPYIYLGWVGVFIYAVGMLILPFAYFLLFKRFPLADIGMAVLCTIYFFSIFDNMLINSGISLQLIYPLFYIKSK